MTPLFPNNLEQITIQQGRGGDCYLLASLDCLFNLGEEGFNSVKSCFTEMPNGDVVVRLKNNNHSNHLKLSNMNGKYSYKYDPATKEDVFTISKERLEKIDSEKGGVRSNSLAVKILERLTSYYYVGNWDADAQIASVNAHNINNRVLDGESTTGFVAKLLGIHAHDMDKTEISDVIKLKRINPDEAIYISMAYGERDEHGRIHGRHALRIKEIRLNNQGEYEFVLVNPWNNTKIEIFSAQEVLSRRCRFSLFSVDENRYQLSKKLLSLSEVKGSYVFQDPDLLKMLIQVQKKYPQVKTQLIDSFIQLYQQHPNFVGVYNQFRNDEQTLLNLISDSKGSLSEFSKALRNHQAQKSKQKFTLQEVVNQAIAMKTKDFNGRVKTAQAYVEDGIINFYFFNSIDSVTRAAQLRDNFSNQHFNRDAIEQYFPSQCLLANAIRYFGSSQVAKNYIQKSNASAINETVLEFLITSSINNPKDLFVLIYHLNQSRPDLATPLFKLALNKKRLFGISCEDFAKEMNKEAHHPFNTWFLNNYLNEKSDDYLEQINKLPASFQGMKTVKEISDYALLLNRQLNNILSPFSYSLFNRKVQSSFFRKQTELNSNAQRRIQQLESLEQSETQAVVEEYEKKILEFPLVFNAPKTIQELEQLKEALILEVTGLSREEPLRNTYKKLAIGPGCHHPKISDAIHLKIKQINQRVEIIKSQAQREGKRVLEKSGYLEQLSILKDKKKELKKNAKTDSNYSEAAVTGVELYKQLVNAKDTFLDSLEPMDRRCNQLKDTCLKAIEKAQPVLEKHRGWKEFFANMANVFVSLGTLGIANLCAGRFRLFRPQTDSALKLKELETHIHKLG